VHDEKYGFLGKLGDKPTSLCTEESIVKAKIWD